MFEMSRVGSGRVWAGQEVFQSHGSGQVGSRVFQNSRVEEGRVGWGQDFFKAHGSGRVGSRGDENLTGGVKK